MSGFGWLAQGAVIGARFDLGWRVNRLYCPTTANESHLLRYDLMNRPFHSSLLPWSKPLWLLVLCLNAMGCGATKSFTATEQLLMSDAVDSTVAKIDFSPLDGQRVYLDTTFLTGARTNPNLPNSALTPQTLINADYVVSTVRQQMIAAGCLIEEKKDEADLVAEIRIGALGTDGHAVTYGIPASNLLSSASTVVAGAPSIPAIPEISFAKKELKSGAAKIAVFAYDRQTHAAVWQSGIEQAGSNSRDTWVLGIGPFQNGTVYGAARFAGKRIFKEKSDDGLAPEHRPGIGLRDRHFFANALKKKPNVEQAQAEPTKEGVVTAAATGTVGTGVLATETTSAVSPTPAAKPAPAPVPAPPKP